MDRIADCTRYLKDAHDSLHSSDRKVFVPVGKLKVTSPVTFTKTVIIEGAIVAHLSGTIILMDGSGKLILTGSSSGVRDILIDVIAVNTGNGITMLNNRPWLENVTPLNQEGMVFKSDPVLILQSM